MYADEYSRFSGGGDQFANVLKMSKAPPGLSPFNVTMPKYQKSNFAKYVGKKSSDFRLPLPKPATLINIAVLAAVGLGGYKLYTMFFGQDALSKKQSAGDAAIASHYVDSNQAKADSLTNLQNQVGVPSADKTSIANNLHDLLNSDLVDHDAVIKIIKSLSKIDFQSVSVAYGYRDLNTYLNSIFHIFNPSNWGVGSVFSTGKVTGTLHDALIYVLYSSEQSDIADWLKVIS